MKHLRTQQAAPFSRLKYVNSGAGVSLNVEPTHVEFSVPGITRRFHSEHLAPHRAGLSTRGGLPLPTNL